MESVGKRHASVGLAPAVQQLVSYAPPMVANCGDGFRCAGWPKEIILACGIEPYFRRADWMKDTQAIGSVVIDRV
jgi:hypothetical protein